MARAFHAAVASLAAATASPLRSKNPASGRALVNLQWLLRKRANKVRHQMGQHDDDDEGASMFAGSTPGTPYSEQRKRGGEALTRLRSAVLAVLARARRTSNRRPLGPCSCVTGTIFGRRRGRVHIVLQADPSAPPALAVELEAYSTGALVREMASGLVRLALECQRTTPQAGDPSIVVHRPTGDHKAKRRLPALVEEPAWHVYCNGRKCGYAVSQECGAEEWRVLRAVEPVSVGAGVIPKDECDVTLGDVTLGDGDMMYMRAKFERVVGSRDSEAFCMVNPDHGGGAPELSIYLLRV